MEGWDEAERAKGTFAFNSVSVMIQYSLTMNRGRGEGEREEGTSLETNELIVHRQIVPSQKPVILRRI